MATQAILMKEIDMPGLSLKVHDCNKLANTRIRGFVQEQHSLFDLSLRCLTLSLRRDGRHKWVNSQ